MSPARRSRQQQISDPSHHDWFTMLPNLLDVWLDEQGQPLEHWAIRVYFHFARLCGTSRDGHAQESERETARCTGMSSGQAHRARSRLAETGWITLEYEGPAGHEVAYITLTDRWGENSEYWARLRAPQPERPGLRSYIERKPADGGAHSLSASAPELAVCAPELREFRSAKTVPSSSPVKDRRSKEPEEARDGATAARPPDGMTDDDDDDDVSYAAWLAHESTFRPCQSCGAACTPLWLRRFGGLCSRCVKHPHPPGQLAAR